MLALASRDERVRRRNALYGASSSGPQASARRMRK